MEITWRTINGKERGENGGTGTGIRSINGRYKIQREVETSIGNGEANELIGTTHGYELRGRECWWEGMYTGQWD